MATTYTLQNLLVSGAAYQGYDLIAYMFCVTPDNALISINTIPVGTIYDATLSNHWDTITNNLVLWIISGGLGSPSYYGNYLLGKFTSAGTTYYYAMSRVNANGESIRNVGQAGLWDADFGILRLNFSDTLVAGQPIIGCSKLFGLPTRRSCAQTVNLTLNQNITL